MNIIYGGSFNPPTLAHKFIIDELYRVFNPNNLIVVPTGNSYKKPELIDEQHRFNMVKMLDERIIVSNKEFTARYNGTYKLLEEFSEEYDDLHYVIGADNLYKLNAWINAEKLLSEYKFIVFNRGNIDLKTVIDALYPTYKENFKIVNLKCDISSSKFRETLDESLIPKNIYKYIKENNLYGVK